MTGNFSWGQSVLSTILWINIFLDPSTGLNPPRGHCGGAEDHLLPLTSIQVPASLAILILPLL